MFYQRFTNGLRVVKRPVVGEILERFVCYCKTQFELFEEEDFLHHGESLTFRYRERLEIGAHGLLPALIDWIMVEDFPSPVKIIDAHAEEQVLILAEDRVIGNPDLLQFGQ